MCTVKVGDAIVVWSKALVCGDDTSDSYGDSDHRWKWLGRSTAISWRNTPRDHETLCTVIAIITDDDEPKMNHFHVLLPDGQVARVFNDRLKCDLPYARRQGYWRRPEEPKTKYDDREVTIDFFRRLCRSKPTDVPFSDEQKGEAYLEVTLTLRSAMTH
jgi:hypothetical protein